MDVEIRDLPDRKVLYVRRKGIVGGTFTTAAKDAYDALNAYLYKHELMPHTVSCIGITPDDPDVVPDEDCRFDACIELAQGVDYRLEGDVQEQTI